MFEKKSKLIILSCVTVLLFLGSSFFAASLASNSYKYTSGNISDGKTSNPDTSSLNTYSGSDGSNLGLVGYANGTKQGYYENSPSDWSLDQSNNNYYRTSDEAFPVPNTSPWTVTGVQANVSNVIDNRQFISDPTFDKGYWSPKSGASLNASNGDHLIYGSNVGTISTPGNSYFNGKDGIQMKVGSDHADTSIGMTGSTVTWGALSSTGVTYNEHSSHEYYDSVGGSSTNDYNQINWAAYGYQSSTSSGWWNDPYFTYNGAPSSIPPPNMGGYTEAGGSFSPDTSTGVVSASAHFWTYATSGMQTPKITTTTEDVRAECSTNWNDNYEYDNQITQPINWVDDGSAPESMVVSYSIQKDSSTTGDTTTYFNTPNTYQNDADHHEGGGVTVTAELIDPSGTVAGSDTPRYFGNGYDIDSSKTWITSTTLQTFTWNVTNLIHTTGSSTPWSIRFLVQIDLKNYGAFNNIVPSSYTYGSSGGAYSAIAVELQTKNSIGIKMSGISVTTHDETPWNKGNNPSNVLYKLNTINFGGRVVPAGADPTISFDWYAQDGIQGYNTENGDPKTGLQYGYPVAEIIYEDSSGKNNSVWCTGSSTIADVRNRTVAQSGYSWLGQSYQWGADHFSYSWPAGETALDGASYIWIYIGFQFTNEFITNYYTGSWGNNSLYITNCSFDFDSEPLPSNIGMQLVWNNPSSGNVAMNVVGTSGGVGSVSSTTALQDYASYPSAEDLYFRINDASHSCSMNWSITLFIQYQYWGHTTTWKVTSTGEVNFDANFTMYIPSESGFVQNYKNNFWFDLIFPRYQMATNGEPYWTLKSAYESTTPSNMLNVMQGTTNITQAENAKSSKIEVFQNSTDNNLYAPILGNNLQYVQFARFHNQLFQQYLSQTSLKWNILFTAPNYVSGIELSGDGFTTHTNSSVFYSNETCQVRGLYAANMINVDSNRTDMGNASVNWYDPSNKLLPGSSNPTSFSSADITNQNYNQVTSAYNLSVMYPGTGYSAAFKYEDSNVCGLSGGVSGGYCSGVFRVGYKTTPFTVMRNSIVSPVYIPIPKNSTDYTPTYDTSVSHQPFPIMVSWSDSNGTSLVGATAKISIATWSINSQAANTKIAQNLSPWVNAPMKNLNNGSYCVWIDPDYLNHAGNMTQGYHNFTISLSKSGYDTKLVRGNFSIVVDSVMEILNPKITQTEPTGWSEGGQRTNFDDQDCFADQPYEFSVWLKENASQDIYFVNQPGSYYYPFIHANYQLIGFEENATSGIKGISSYDNPQFLNWTWFDNFYNISTSDTHDSFINGSLTSANGVIFTANVTWPSFAITADEGMPLYKAGIHVYYNITMWIGTNRTEYTLTDMWQPNDVKPEYCIDKYANSPVIVSSYPQMLGMTLHQQDTGNETYLSIINNATDNNYAFNFTEPGTGNNGVLENDPTHYGEYADYQVVNYWYNATSDKFRLRVALDCYKGIAENTTSPYDYAPPAGPLNESAIMFGENMSSWSGLTNITMTGWNGTVIPFTNDSNYLWNTTVDERLPITYANGSTGWSINDNATAYGETYVSPWLYFNQTSVGTHYLLIGSNKRGFINSNLVVTVNVLKQQTGIFNTTNSSQQYSQQKGKFVYLTTATGISTSVVVQYNDTTNPGVNTAVDGATVSCVSDDWEGHYSSNENITWTWQDLGNGVYNISLIDTNLTVLIPIVKTLTIQIVKGNYSAALFNIAVTITPREMKIIYLGGRDKGYYLPWYVESNFTDFNEIQLTFGIVDLENHSAAIDFTSNQMSNNFRFQTTTGTYYNVYVKKFTNSTGDFNYNLTINSNINLYQPNNPNSNPYWLASIVNFSISGVVNYYSASITHQINITAVQTGIQMRTPTVVTTQYLWNSSTNWISQCPQYNFNVTDLTYGALLNKNLPISVDSISLYSNFTNPNRNGIDSVNPGTPDEDIFYRSRSALDGSGNGYEYLQIILDTRGIDVVNNINFYVTITMPNYLNATVDLTLNIENATTNIENNRIYVAAIANKPTNWEGTGQDAIYWNSYQNTNGLNNFIIPWNEYFAMKCEYQSGPLVINATGSSSQDQVYQAIEGLNSSFNLVPQYYQLDMENYFYFHADIPVAQAYNNNLTIVVWKYDFNPAYYTVNYTIRPRYTDLYNETSFNLAETWTGTADFTFRYVDLDTAHTDGIPSAEVNDTSTGSSGPEFNFGDNLTASWTLNEQSNGRYTIMINTTGLMARTQPYQLTFGITKRVDNIQHWNTQVFTVNLTVNPIQLIIAPYFEAGNLQPTKVGSPNQLNSPFLLNPTDYSQFTMYLQIYAMINGQKHYFTDDSQLNVSGTLYNWNNVNETYVTNKTNEMSFVSFNFVQVPQYSGSFKGFWEASLKLNYLNSPGLVTKGFPSQVQLYGYIGIVINATTTNPNYSNGSITKGMVVLSGTPFVPWYVWLMVTAVGAVAVVMSGYGIRKALQARIPYVLRMIDESIDKISKDKFPTVGVMMGRSEFVINQVIEYLDICGIEWETADKYEVESTRAEEEEEEGLPPMTHEELTVELNKIETLTPDERMLFIDELKQLDRKAQIEFLKSLQEESE